MDNARAVEYVESAVANLGGDRAEALREMRGHYFFRARKQRGDQREVAVWLTLARAAHAMLVRPAR